MACNGVVEDVGQRSLCSGGHWYCFKCIKDLAMTNLEKEGRPNGYVVQGCHRLVTEPQPRDQVTASWPTSSDMHVLFGRSALEIFCAAPGCNKFWISPLRLPSQSLAMEVLEHWAMLVDAELQHAQDPDHIDR